MSDAATPNPALDAARKEFDDAREDLEKRLEAVTAERDAEKQRADKAEAGLAKAKTRVTRTPAPAKPRTIAPVKDGLSGDKLAEAIAAAGEVEIAFSDGKREIAGIDLIQVEGDAWKPSLHGLMLREPVEIAGPAKGPGFQIAGYGLLLDGKLVAYTARSSPVNVPVGGKVRLADDIAFA